MVLSILPVSVLQTEVNAQTSTEMENDYSQVRLTYEREDRDYEDWDVWVWNTGVEDDNHDFTQFENGFARSYIDVATDEIGFIIRKGDWEDREPNGQEIDRYIHMNQQDPLTKVHVKQGEEAFHIVPGIPRPTLDEGTATFYYRDQNLYLQDNMDAIDTVQLQVAGDMFDMRYDEKDERFVYEYHNFPQGEYNYSFIVTMGQDTYRVTDPYYEDSTIENRSYDITVLGEVHPKAIDYNENAVLTLEVLNEEDAEIRSLYADVSALGGPERLEIDPEILEVTIAVTHDTTAGEKTIPLFVVDENGDLHQGEVTVEVKTRQIVGKDDFDWDEALIYFLLTDRFFDGDHTNNDPYGLNYTNDRGTYQGGDFKGLTEKLDYLDELGINTIWISPIVENIKYDVRFNDDSDDQPYYAYHGYWASDFERLNPHFGTMEDFHELIDAAAERNIKIMVDVVLNHAGYGLKMADGELAEEARPDGYPTDEERTFFTDLLRQNGEIGNDDITGELAGLPDFKTEDSEVRQKIIDWQTAWIEKSRTENGNTIDYFRVDTVKHVEDTTWKAFKNALTREMPEFKMIGEAWGTGQSDDQGYLSSGTMDALLDFEFKSTARDFVNGHIEKAHQQLVVRNSQLNNTATLGQFLGSHDEAGFLQSVDGNIGKLKVAASLQITAKGQPVIYYGEELGLSGMDNYPYYDNRYDMAWDSIAENDILEHYQKVIDFRNQYSAILAKGDRQSVVGSDEDALLLFERSLNGESVYVGLNTSEEVKQVEVTVNSEAVKATDHYSDTVYEASQDETLTVSLPPISEGGTVLLTTEGGEILGSEDEDRETDPVTQIPENTLRVHYQRADGDFSDLGLWVWEDVVTPSEEVDAWPDGATPFEQITDDSAYVDVPIVEDASRVGMLVNNSQGDNLSGDIFIDPIYENMNEVWITEEGDISLYEPVELPEDTLRIHYHREDGQYEPWGVWSWGDVADPSEDWPMDAEPLLNDQLGPYGAYVDITLIDDPDEIGFLFVERDENGEQTGDMSFADSDHHKQIFVRENDDTVYTNPYYVTEDGLNAAEQVSEGAIELRFTTTDRLNEEDLRNDLTVTNHEGHEVELTEVEILTEDNIVLVRGTFNIDLAPYNVTYRDETVTAHKGWRLMDEVYAYDGTLGSTLHKDGTATLKLWSPSADQVNVILYHRDDQDKVVSSHIPMILGERGVWEATLDENNTGEPDLNGFYYHYEIERDGEKVLTLDPYAKSMATWDSNNTDEVPIGKAAIVDPSSIGPELEFAKIDGVEKREDAVIYEIHVRDFTSDPSIDDQLQQEFGTFASFVEKLDYIQDLGVTHIQLLPVMSYFFADEFNRDQRLLEYASTQNNYNWGYDPHSYFSLSGMYSEDPDDAEKRIEEFKNLIKEIHRRDMGVILDVVYNHTARVEIFENLEPNYYHFMDADGTPRESFGGGRLGTTHEMARKILVDSITYWVDTFKVDGFRFDMMGDHDAESIQTAYDRAKAINPNIIMIGEGWRTFVGDEHGEEVMPADQDWMQHTQSVGSFSDDFRNELKSGFGHEGEPRFITGGARNIQQIFDNVTANPHNFVATNPGDVVPYIAAHDNLTLHDVIAVSIKKDPKDHQEEIHQRIRLGNTMLLTAQGTAFIHAGQEYGRTKQFKHEDYKEVVEDPPYKSTLGLDREGQAFEYPYFIHDSYDSTDAINMFDWQKATNEEAYPIHTLTRDYTKGLIALRRSTDAFRLGTIEDIESNVSLINAPEIHEEDLIIGYKTMSTDGTEAYYVFVNADEQTRTLTLNYNLNHGSVIVDKDEAGVTAVKSPSGFKLTGNKITLDPLTAVVVKVEQPEKKRDAADNSEHIPTDRPKPPRGLDPQDQRDNNNNKNASENSIGEDAQTSMREGAQDKSKAIKRAQFVDELVRVLELEMNAATLFTDVAHDAWYAQLLVKN
nr:pullulanase [Caldalkalibacillus salinus]